MRKRLTASRRLLIPLLLVLSLFTTFSPLKRTVRAKGRCDVEFTVEDDKNRPIEETQIIVMHAIDNQPVGKQCLTDNQGKCTVILEDEKPKTGCLYGDSGLGSGSPLFKYQATKTGYLRDIGLIKWNDMSVILKPQTPSDCQINTDKIQYAAGETVDILNSFVKSQAGKEVFVALIKPNGDAFGGQCVEALSGDGHISTSITLDDTQGEWRAAVFRKASYGCSGAGSAICTSLTPFLVGLGASSRLNCANSDVFKSLNAERCACELGKDVRKICNAGCGSKLSECSKPECGGCPQCPDQVALAPNPDVEGTWTAFGCLPNKPQSFAAVFLKLLVGVGGGLAFLVILRGAFLILTSQGDPEKITQGKDWITSAIFGLLFMIFATVILTVIGVDILRIPGFAR